MGTLLGGQSPRDDYRVSFDKLDSFLEDAGKLAKKHSIAIESVIDAKRVLEMERRCSVAVQAGDYLDEQASGFGEILLRIASALEDLS